MEPDSHHGAKLERVKEVFSLRSNALEHSAPGTPFTTYTTSDDEEESAHDLESHFVLPFIELDSLDDIDGMQWVQRPLRISVTASADNGALVHNLIDSFNTHHEPSTYRTTTVNAADFLREATDAFAHLDFVLSTRFSHARAQNSWQTWDLLYYAHVKADLVVLLIAHDTLEQDMALMQEYESYLPVVPVFEHARDAHLHGEFCGNVLDAERISLDDITALQAIISDPALRRQTMETSFFNFAHWRADHARTSSIVTSATLSSVDDDDEAHIWPVADPLRSQASIASLGLDLLHCCWRQNTFLGLASIAVVSSGVAALGWLFGALVEAVLGTQEALCWSETSMLYM